MKNTKRSVRLQTPRAFGGRMLGLLACIFTFISRADQPAGAASDVTRTTLTNGLQVIIVRNTLAPVVSTELNYRVGSDECPSNFPGTAHATEHMMFRGSPGLSADQLANVSAAMGGDFDADTQQAVTQYTFSVPAEDLDLALRMEATRMRDLVPSEALWNKERGAIEQEVAQDLSNPEYVFYEQLLADMFQGTPYAHDALGTRPSFDKTTDARLRKFHNTWYAPNNAILVIVGNVDPDRTLEKVKEFFGAIPSKQLPARPEFNFQPIKSETLKLDSDLPYGMAAFCFRFPGSDSPDFAAAQVLSDVLSSQRGKLYQLVPDGKALFSSFSYDTLPRAGLGYAVVGFPAGADADALLNNVRDILKAELQNGVQADLVTASKRHEIADAEFEKNSVSGLASEWSEAVAVEGRQSPDDDINSIRNVTVDDVNRVAKQYLDFDHCVTAILTPQPSGKPVSTKSFGGKESFASSKTSGIKLPPWAAKTLDQLNVPESTLSPRTIILPNGLKLIVQTETASDTVSVFGRVHNNPNVQVPPGKEGVDQALGQLFSYGTRSLDRIAFQKALDDIGANESAGADFNLKVLTDQFDRGAQLLADNELAPALPEDDFKIIQPQLAQSTAGELQSPSHLQGKALRAALFPKTDPIQRETTPDTIKALTIQDVLDYYHAAFRPDLTTIVVIGNISPESAQAVIAKYFGGWTAAGPQPDVLYPAVPNNGPSTTQVPDASRVQDKVTLGETLTLTRTNSDYYALQLGNHVLGGAFYATRLYRDLRETSGLVYFVDSRFEVGLTRGVYTVEYACDPPNVSKARAIVVNNLVAMRSHDVTPRELRQAQMLLLRDIPLAEASVDAVAQGWLARSMIGLPLDEPIRAANHYLNLNPDDVRSAFSKWIRPDDLIQVTQGPVPQ